MRVTKWNNVKTCVLLSENVFGWKRTSKCIFPAKKNVKSFVWAFKTHTHTHTKYTIFPTADVCHELVGLISRLPGKKSMKHIFRKYMLLRDAPSNVIIMLFLSWMEQGHDPVNTATYVQYAHAYEGIFHFWGALYVHVYACAHSQRFTASLKAGV